MDIVRNARMAHKMLAGGALISCALLAGTGFASGTSETQPKSVCELLATQKGNMTNLEAIVLPGLAGQGEYRLSVQSTSSGGRSSVNQGGPFSTDGRNVVVLGTITIPAGSHYDASFEVALGGHTYDCAGASDRIV